jgi:2,3-bisphosphoglycerate-dependent phosphoglycerate mutase
MTRLLLVRHGQGKCNVDRTIEGRAICRGLSELGMRQASATADRLARENFTPDVFLSSPIRRASQTAEVISHKLGIPMTLDPDLEEVRPGEAEGMTWDQYFAYYGTTEGWQPDVPFAPGAEAWSAFATRVGGAIDRIAHAHEGKVALLVCHGGVVDASLFHFFGLDPMVQAPIDFETTNASLTEWERRHSPGNPMTGGTDPELHRWRLSRYNDAAHVLSIL